MKTKEAVLDIPRIFNLTESAHRIHNPFTPEKLDTLGAALRLESGTRMLDLGSGSGEKRCQGMPGPVHFRLSPASGTSRVFQ